LHNREDIYRGHVRSWPILMRMILIGIMSRLLRIEYPAAWYHVMNRGRRAEDIFSDEQDYRLWVAVRQIISFFINYCYYGFHILNSVKMKIIGVMKTKSQRLHF